MGGLNSTLSAIPSQSAIQGGLSGPFYSFLQPFGVYGLLLAPAGNRWHAFIPAHSRFHPNHRKELGLGEQVSRSL